ncbi:DUF6187 family protein [Streptomyces bambusae]|uniref:DUF6187 family protein n=1 Tax=Streptomyces bambusae TaxID=1550616 RepID=UPI001CFCF6A3|nr:DUF6187 family protein [Streptomyces bambusae]MCB5165805.1 DUF6187 family protein [Streptomyces bambusae]
MSDRPHLSGLPDPSDGPEPQDYDPRFALNPVDEPAFTETGVMLMGLDADRLLAGLGLAALADDPAQVVLAVDRARHGVTAALDFDALVVVGTRRWRDSRPALTAAGSRPPVTAPLRRAWGQTLRMLAHCDIGEAGPATTAHLAACWLRRDEIDRCADRVLA